MSHWWLVHSCVASFPCLTWPGNEANTARRSLGIRLTLLEEPGNEARLILLVHSCIHASYGLGMRLGSYVIISTLYISSCVQMVTGSFSWSVMLAALVCYPSGERCTASSVSPLLPSPLTLQHLKLLDLRYICRVIIVVLHSNCDRLSINHPFAAFCWKWDIYTNRKLTFRWTQWWF